VPGIPTKLAGDFTQKPVTTSQIHGLVANWISGLFGVGKGKRQKAARVNGGLRESPAKEFDRELLQQTAAK
jgi:hypothetical protein